MRFARFRGMSATQGFSEAHTGRRTQAEAPGARWMWLCLPAALLVVACAGTAGFLAMSGPVEFNSIISGVAERARDVIYQRPQASFADTGSRAQAKAGDFELKTADVAKRGSEEWDEHGPGGFRQHLDHRAFDRAGALNQLGGAPSASLYSMLTQGRFNGGASEAEPIESGFAALEVAVIPEPTSTVGIGAGLTFLVFASRRRAARRDARRS